MIRLPRFAAGLLCGALVGAAGAAMLRRPDRDSAINSVETVSATTPSQSLRTESAIAPWQAEFERDLPALVAKLRLAGYPESIVQAIVATLVHERIAGASTQSAPEGTLPSYWMANFERLNLARARTRQNQLMKEAAGEIAKIFGKPLDNTGADSPDRHRYPSLSPDKVRAVRAIRDDFFEMKEQIAAAANGLLLPDDMAKLAYLEKQERAELSRVLAPEELEDFELRNSNTAENLRNKLSLFRPTEDEFKALYRVQRAIDEESPLPGVGQNDLALQRERRFLEQAAAAIPADRVAELQLAADPANTLVNKIVGRYGLPLQTTADIRKVQQETVGRARRLAGDPTLSPADRSARFAALSQEATATLTGLLGPDAFGAYEQAAGGWLKQLKARPQRTSARNN